MRNRHTPPLTRGEALFLDDVPEPADLVHGTVFTSPLPHARVIALDTSAAEASPGVVAVLRAADVPGQNQIGAIIQDEPLLAEGEVHFTGQPLVLVVAETPEQARAAARAVRVELEELPPIFDPRLAAARGQLISPSRTLCLGDPDAVWADCEVVVSGRVDSGGQEHLYLETQGSIAWPQEQGGVKILAGTQAPTAVQRIAARVLGLAMNAVEVEVVRLGGAFGGKEDQATVWAVMAALAAHRVRRPVKLVLSRLEDLRWTGKRHPYSSDFTIGLDHEGKILAYEVTLYQNAGAAADLSPAILERTMFHATASYAVPNARVTALSCRTNLPPNTAMRGFGAPQAMFVMEAAIHKAAIALGREPSEIQRANLLDDHDRLPFGMEVTRCRARRAFAEAARRYRLAELQDMVRAHNREHRLSKRGVAAMPVCFGISFTTTFLNQASALVHVYTDGSVGVSTGAVEMGQGVNMKILAVAAHTLGVAPERITVASTSTARVANTSPTAASSGADMNGRATETACASIRERLTAVAAGKLGCRPDDVTIAEDQVLRGGASAGLGWEELVWLAYTSRVNLSAQAHYATPGIHYDKIRERGTPFAYHVYGTAVVEVSLDCLRGTYTVDRVGVVHDAGRSLDPLIDRGQVEGGLLQGIGWMTMEELVYDQGRVVSDSLTTYKVPDIHAAPEVSSCFLEDADNPAAVLSSKAIGEPPFMYGIGAYFALLEAMRSFRPDREGLYSAPLTPEKVLLYLYGESEGDELPMAYDTPLVLHLPTPAPDASVEVGGPGVEERTDDERGEQP